jgi:hypothetical protein
LLSPKVWKNSLNNGDEIMDTIATIIVTAFINIIITGIVTNLIFYRYQKRIEESFSEKLEQFRHGLQKLSTEHHVKFSRNYPKTVEVLETYNQRLYEYFQICHQLHLVIIKTIRGELLESTEIQGKREEFDRVVSDFSTYLPSVRLYLPNELIKELVKIADRADRLGMASMRLFERAKGPIEDIVREIRLLTILAQIPANNFVDSEKFPKHMIGYFSTMNEDDPNEDKLYKFTFKIDLEFISLLQRLEELYKSVTDTDPANSPATTRQVPG